MSITKKVIVFIFPVFLFFLFPILVLYISGEFIAADDALLIQQRSNKTVLLGKAYLSYEKSLKITRLLDHQPEVTTLGNSRVLQFREDFFKKDVRFYNIGEAASIPRLKVGLNIFPEDESPKLIIVGLEQSYFLQNESEEDLREYSPQSAEEESIHASDILYAVRNIYSDYIHRKFTLRGLLEARKLSNSVGVNALVTQTGMRSDGSHRYGNIIRDPTNPSLEDYNFKETLERVERGERGFEYSDSISPFAIDELQSFLDEAENRNIHIVAFLPPYAPTVYTKMMSTGNKYGYISKIKLQIQPLFDKHHFTLFDFTDALLFDSVDAEFVDGWHGSEKTYLRLFIAMAEIDLKLGAYVDIPHLIEVLQSSESNLEVF